MHRHWLLVLLLLLGYPPALSAQTRDGWPTHLALGGYMIAGFADTAQTAYCLGAQTCREVNPIFKSLIARHGLVPSLTAKGSAHVLVSYLLLRQHQHHPRAVLWTSIGIAALQSAVVLHNARGARQIGRARSSER